MIWAYLEHHVHDEHLVTLGSEGVKTVCHGSNDADHHTNHHHALEEGAENSIQAVGHGVTEEEHPESREDGARYHEYEAELGFTKVKRGGLLVGCPELHAMCCPSASLLTY